MPPISPRDLPSQRQFALSVDGARIPLVITNQALDDFILQSMPAMDEYLMRMTARLTPANDPDQRPSPLGLIGNMMLDGAKNGNTRKLVLCALWLAHHYPSVSGLTAQGQSYTFEHKAALPYASATA